MKIEELQKPLDPKHVTKGNQNSFGPKGDYIEGWHAIAEANRIFGFDGWSYTIDLTQNGLVEGKDKHNNVQWQAAYTCVCTVTVQCEHGTVIRQDVGFGSGYAKQAGDAIEGATKEAATDALKRALRTFGNPFGLALYDKSGASVGVAKITDDQRAEVIALCEARNFPVARVLEAKKITDLRQLPADSLDGAKAWIERESQKGEAA